MKELQKQVNDWQMQTFGLNLPSIYFKKLDTEIDELAVLIFNPHVFNNAMSNPYVEEIADCLICLLGIAGALGIDAEKAVKSKLRILQKRKWKKQKDGTFQHL